MNIKKITFSSQLNNPYKRSYVAQTMKTAPSKSAAQNSPIDDKDNENSNDFSENRKNRILMYFAAAGTIAAAGIYLYKNKSFKGKITSPVSSSSSATSGTNSAAGTSASGKISDYVKNIAANLEMYTGKNINPESLSCIMSKEEFLQSVSKLKRENYVASKENIENGIFKADLHSHSNYSDGEAPVSVIMEQVAAYADKLFQKTGDKFIFALTDHDCANGVKEALKIISNNPVRFKNVKFTIGSEVSYLIKADKTSNPCETSELLIYGFNPFSPKVEEFFRNVLDRRIQTRRNYIRDLSEKFPDTKFSEDEFLNVFLKDKTRQFPMMNSYWQIYHYGQIKKVLSDTAKAKNFDPEQYFKDIMSKAPDRLNLEEFKKNNLIENWITENPEIRTINDKYKPELDNNGNIIKKCENLVEDIFEAFHGEKECCAGFAHPFYITERTGNVQGVIDEVKYKMGDLLKVTESYHQAYSPELVKNQSEMIEQISKQCEGRSLIPIGGRDNHSSNFMV